MTESPHALIVDDDDQFSFLVETYLSMLGISSDVAQNGIDALEMIEEKNFDFIMTDFKMPLMNGLQLLEKIKGNPNYQSIKTIFVTGGGADVNDICAAENLADQYILKPFTLETLKDKIHSLNLEQ